LAAVQKSAGWIFEWLSDYNQTLAMEKGDIKTLCFSRAGKQIIAGDITLGTTQALALAAAGFDDNEPAEYVRERSLIIPIGEKKYVTVPMPLGFHVIPNIGRVSTEFALGGSGSQLTIQCDWRPCLRKRSIRWAVPAFPFRRLLQRLRIRLWLFPKTRIGPASRSRRKISANYRLRLDSPKTRIRRAIRQNGLPRQ
jgi:hypothetical protein